MILPMFGLCTMQVRHQLRLNLKPKQTFDVVLKVDRDKPNTTGEIHQKLTVKSIDRGTIWFEDTLVGLSINGRDRTADLKRILSNQSVTFGWNSRAQRIGDMSPLGIRERDDEIFSVLGEAGLYLCEFPESPAKPDSVWMGSTTATGGCTVGKYRLKDWVEDHFNVEVTDIQFQVPVDPVGPMKMEVDSKTGMPRKVEYSVRGRKSGRVSHYVQTIKQS